MTETHPLANRPDMARRKMLLGGSVLAASLFIANVTAASAQPGAQRIGEITMQAVQFDNSTIKMAGNVYYPKGFTEGRKYPAIVSVHPGGGVKEQTAGLYAQKLAQHGFVVLTFDASHQGASGGTPRFLDDPMKRVGDIYSAVDYLTTLPFVDSARIGALGICAGSGHTIKAATTDRRIKAVATVSAVDVGVASRKGWEGRGAAADQMAGLEAAAKQRTAEAAGAAPVYVPYVPQVGDKTAPLDLQEAADYYLTPRGQHPNAPNKMLLTSTNYMIAYTGFDRVEELLTQPVMIIAGTKAGSLWHSQELHAKAPGPKELFLIEGATHMDLYDGKGADTAADKLAPFFTRNL